MGFFTYLGELINKAKNRYPFGFYVVVFITLSVLVFSLKMYIGSSVGVATAGGMPGNANIVAMLESRIEDLEKSLGSLGESNVALGVVPDDGSGWYYISAGADLYTQYRYILNDLGYSRVNLRKGFSGLDEGYNIVVANDEYGIEQLDFILREYGDVAISIHIVGSITEVDSELGTNVVSKLPITVHRSENDIKIYEGINKEVDYSGR